MRYAFQNREHTLVKCLDDGSTFELPRHTHPSNVHGFAAERWRAAGCPTPEPYQAPLAPKMPDDADRKRRRDAALQDRRG